MYLALYRKFRPTTFDKVVGQEHISRILKNQIEENRIGHAYLFTGPRGTGKTSFAKIFARAVNCLQPVDGSPCGVCDICRENLDNLDIIEIDAASNNRVEEVRDLREKVGLMPTFAKYKVYIIDEVHMLSGAAFNALLKTLEEPPAHVIFLLATTEVAKLPATILSRCMRFDFKLLETVDIARHIAGIYRELGFEASKEAIFQLAKAGNGSVRDALSVADTAMGAVSGARLEKEDVWQIIGGVEFSDMLALCGNILAKNSEEALKVFAKILSDGKTTQSVTKELCAFLRELLWLKVAGDCEKGFTPAEIAEMNSVVANVTSAEISACLEGFVKVEGAFRYSQNPRVLFEVEIFAHAKTSSVAQLAKRVAKIEKIIAQGGVDNFSATPQNTPRQ